MRHENFAPNEHYHVSGRGVNNENIFLDDQDKARFIFLITHFQSPTRIYNVTWYTDMFLKKGVFSTQEKRIEEILKDRNVKLIAFTLMSNHFHLLIQNLDEGILSVYMHRILTAYSKYFNGKYHRRGHVFEGPYKAVRVKNNTQLAELSACIHKIPKEIKDLENTYDKYLYSSYQDYIGLNRWGNFLTPDIVLKQFKDQAKYKDFVSKSSAKID